MLISNMIFLVVSLRRVASNTSGQRSRSGLCAGVIRREATETEGLVFLDSDRCLGLTDVGNIIILSNPSHSSIIKNCSPVCVLVHSPSK